MMSALGKLTDRGRRVSEDLDSHYPLRPGLVDARTSQFRPKVGKRLSARAWHNSFRDGGQLDFVRVIERIQRGGVEPSIRGEVWEFLLGCYSADSSSEARNALRTHRRKEYEKFKKACMSMDSAVGSGQILTALRPEAAVPRQINGSDAVSRLQISVPEAAASLQQNGSEADPELHANGPEAEGNREGLRRRKGKDESEQVLAVSTEKQQSNGWVDLDEPSEAWRGTLHQIGLDVERTDRMLEFYEDVRNRSRLWDILAVYAWFDPEIGYCQGMSDLCSPMVLLYHNEADAFWCFQHLMARVRSNFVCTEAEVGVQRQLEHLASIVKVMDPKLHQHLEALGGGSYLFAFRMLMVLFRREFSFADTLYLWEMMWASEFVPIGADQVFRDHRAYGKFGLHNQKYGNSRIPGGYAPLAVYCMAAIFKLRRQRLLKETFGLDDVLKLLNDTAGKVDAKVACKKAVRLHRAYLIKPWQTHRWLLERGVHGLVRRLRPAGLCCTRALCLLGVSGDGMAIVTVIQDNLRDKLFAVKQNRIQVFTEHTQRALLDGSCAMQDGY